MFKTIVYQRFLHDNLMNKWLGVKASLKCEAQRDTTYIYTYIAVHSNTHHFPPPSADKSGHAAHNRTQKKTPKKIKLCSGLQYKKGTAATAGGVRKLCRLAKAESSPIRAKGKQVQAPRHSHVRNGTPARIHGDNGSGLSRLGYTETSQQGS